VNEREKIMDTLTSMLMCWSGYIVGKRTKEEAVQEVRKGSANIIGWLEDFENGAEE
jgi:hypothetical protein